MINCLEKSDDKLWGTINIILFMIYSILPQRTIRKEGKIICLAF